jgi:hypothetical protein
VKAHKGRTFYSYPNGNRWYAACGRKRGHILSDDVWILVSKKHKCKRCLKLEN